MFSTKRGFFMYRTPHLYQNLNQKFFLVIFYSLQYWGIFNFSNSLIDHFLLNFVQKCGVICQLL